jgi:hypothetical protein
VLPSCFWLQSVMVAVLMARVLPVLLMRVLLRA